MPKGRVKMVIRRGRSFHQPSTSTRGDVYQCWNLNHASRQLTAHMHVRRCRPSTSPGHHIKGDFLVAHSCLASTIPIHRQWQAAKQHVPNQQFHSEIEIAPVVAVIYQQEQLHISSQILGNTQSARRCRMPQEGGWFQYLESRIPRAAGIHQKHKYLFLAFAW
jgi:hypothetical protein